jgi:hypothetical protein
MSDIDSAAITIRRTILERPRQGQSASGELRAYRQCGDFAHGGANRKAASFTSRPTT